MRASVGGSPDSGELTRDDAVTYLREAGDHPLMYSFPHGAVFAFDRDLRYLSAGGHGLGDVGLSRHAMEGHTIFEVFPEETARLIEPLYRAALDGTTTTWDVPFEDRIYSQRLAPVTTPAGEIVAGLGFTQDVTEARLAEHALREAEERTRLTFENAPIGQAIVELDGQWRQVNTALTQLLGYPRELLLTMTFQDITHPDDLDLDLDHMNQVLAGETTSYQIEKRYFTASRRIVWVLLSVALVRDDENTPLYFISQIQDITDRKRQQQALQDLTAMLAHDLRTPAAVIRGYAELLQSAGPAGASEVPLHAARIVAAARSMTDLLDNALTATTLDSGQLVATPRPTSVRPAILQVLDTLELGTTVIETADLEDLAVWVDPVHLDQVTINLLTNALKYGGDVITISSSSESGVVRLSIADNGPGVEPEFVPDLFDRYSRSARVRRGRHRGSGLGLYIVRDLLASNGASIRYQPRPSGGAEFIVEFRPPPS